MDGGESGRRNERREKRGMEEKGRRRRGEGADERGRRGDGGERTERGWRREGMEERGDGGRTQGGAREFIAQLKAQQSQSSQMTLTAAALGPR
jgi:hypothetical protein